MLAPPVQEGRYIIDTDASNYAMGAVLQQEQDGVVRVIAYASKIFNSAQRQYCTTRKELAAIIYALKEFRHYVEGRTRFLLRTDHGALTSLFKTPVPMMQTSGYLNFLANFNFEIQHRPGLQHGNSDDMSRRPCSDKKCFRDGCLGRNHHGPGTDDQSGQEGLLSGCSGRGPYRLNVSAAAEITSRETNQALQLSRSLQNGRGYLNPDLVGNKDFAGKRKRQQKTNGPRTKKGDPVGHGGVELYASLKNQSQPPMEYRTGNR